MPDKHTPASPQEKNGIKNGIKTGILLTHGLFGSPEEFAPQEQRLNRAGFATRRVAQPGHGPLPDRRLRDVRTADMLEALAREYTALAADCDQVLLVGHCLGGVTSLILAGERPAGLVGVVSFSAPFEHAYWVNHGHGLLRLPPKRLAIGLRYMPALANGFAKPAFYPHWYPALRHEADTLFGQLHDALPKVAVPVTLAHSPWDLVIPHAEMVKIASALKAPCQTQELQRCGHQVFPDSRDARTAEGLILAAARDGLNANGERLVMPSTSAL